MTVYYFTKDVNHSRSSVTPQRRSHPRRGRRSRFRLATACGGNDSMPVAALARHRSTARTTGRLQVTYNGLPLYFFANDKAPATPMAWYAELDSRPAVTSVARWALVGLVLAAHGPCPTCTTTGGAEPDRHDPRRQRRVASSPSQLSSITSAMPSSGTRGRADSRNPALREWLPQQLGRLPGLKWIRTLSGLQRLRWTIRAYVAARSLDSPRRLVTRDRCSPSRVPVSPSSEFDEVAAELGRTLGTSACRSGAPRDVGARCVRGAQERGGRRLHVHRRDSTRPHRITCRRPIGSLLGSKAPPRPHALHGGPGPIRQVG